MSKILEQIPLIEIHKELFKRKRFNKFASEGGLIHSKQVHALECLTNSTYKEIGYGGAAGGGKSFLGCYWVTMMCLLYPNTSWFVCRQALVDLRHSSSNTFRKVWKKLGLKEIPHYNGTDHYWKFENSSTIVYLSAEHQPRDPNYERFGSREFTGGWFEEAGQVNEIAYEIARSRVGRQMNKEYNLLPKIFSTFNPAKGFIYQRFYKPFKDGTLEPDTVFLPALVTDNPHIGQDYIDNLKSLKNNVQKERLLYGNFDYDDDPNKLYDYDCILNMFSNSFVESGEKYITADIALQGSDKLVIMVWDGMRIEHIYSEAKSEAKQIETKIKELAERYFIPRSNIIYDNDGVGGYLNSYLKHAIPFANGGKPLNGENYQNLKTQCYFKLAEYINENNIYCSNDAYKESITEELDIIAQDNVDSDGKLKIISKEKMKEKLGRSPDFADAIMMRMYFNLKPAAKLNFEDFDYSKLTL
jgi:phage terminase large subunit